jgi:hypothetical protein
MAKFADVKVGTRQIDCARVSQNCPVVIHKLDLSKLGFSVAYHYKPRPNQAGALG